MADDDLSFMPDWKMWFWHKRSRWLWLCACVHWPPWWFWDIVAYRDEEDGSFVFEVWLPCGEIEIVLYSPQAIQEAQVTAPVEAPNHEGHEERRTE